jgi:hypothetical protein
MGWIEWEKPNVKNFVSYLVGGGKDSSEVLNPTAIEAEVDAKWDAEAWPLVSGLVAGYLTARGEGALHKRPEKGDRAKAWPSSRTWEFAAHAYAGAEIFGLPPEAKNLAVSAFIGSAAYTEFFQWIKDADLPNPADLLDGKVQFQHNKGRLDRTAAVLSSATALVLPTNAEHRDRRVGKLWDLLAPITSSVPDIVVPAVTALCKAKLMTGHHSAFQTLGKMEPVLSAAGIQST